MAATRRTAWKGPRVGEACAIRAVYRGHSAGAAHFEIVDREGAGRPQRVFVWSTDDIAGPWQPPAAAAPEAVAIVGDTERLRRVLARVEERTVAADDVLWLLETATERLEERTVTQAARVLVERLTDDSGHEYDRMSAAERASRSTLGGHLLDPTIRAAWNALRAALASSGGRDRE